MNSKNAAAATADGSVNSPNYYNGPADITADIKTNTRLFAYRTTAGIVAGVDVCITFGFDRPAKDVWPYLKDFNLWQNSYGYYWSRVVGDLYSREARDLGQEAFYISIGNPNEFGKEYPYQYISLKVIPERLLVVFQPIPEDGSNGAVSPGFHVVMLNEHAGKTLVTLSMEHAARTRDQTEEQALAPWRESAEQYIQFWRDSFLPELKKLVYGSREEHLIKR